MHGRGHLLVGAACGLQLGIVSGWSPLQSVTSAAMATALSNGPTSPDADQTWLKMFGHRREVHLIELPVIVGVVLYQEAAPWFAWSLLVGWSSHLLADAVFGRKGWGFGQGVPSILLGVALRLLGRAKRVQIRYLGLGLKSGGDVETRLVVPYVLPLVLAAQTGFLIWTPIRAFL